MKFLGATTLALAALAASFSSTSSFAQQPATAQGMRVHVDPKTGKFVDAPAPGSQPAPAAGGGAVSEPIIIEKGTTPFGGLVVRPPSWIRQETRIQIDPHGAITHNCQPAEHK